MTTLKNQENILFGTMVYDFDKKSIAIIINTWDNTFHRSLNKTIDIRYATCVDRHGKKYNTEFENLTPFDDLEEEQKIKLGLLNLPKKELELSDYKKILTSYWNSEHSHFEFLQERWQDEYKYENPENYIYTIKKQAKKYNIEIISVNLSSEDFSLKISIKLGEKYVGHIDIFENESKIYIKERIVNYVINRKVKS